MNTYGIITIVVAIIFVGILAYFLYTSLRPSCASNQQYISCNGGDKKCYPKCGDNEVLDCDVSACVPVCDSGEQVYGPGIDPSDCSGDYFCGPVCDTSKGKVIDCDTHQCTDACTSPNVPHQCGDRVRCGPDCSDGTSWDCSTSTCVPDKDTYYNCDKSGDFPLLTTEECDPSDACCFQNLDLAASCFDNNRDYWWWVGKTVTDSGSLGDVDMFAQVVSSSDVTVPYQGDSAYRSGISQCSDSSADKKGMFRRIFSKKDTPRKSLQNQKTGTNFGSNPDYPWYGQNYTDKYLRLHAFYTDSNGKKHTKTSAVLPPNMKTSDTVELWDHHDKDWFSITSIDIADSADGDWKTGYYTKEAVHGTTSGVDMGMPMSHNEKIVFQPVNCLADLSTLETAPLCT